MDTTILKNTNAHDDLVAALESLIVAHNAQWSKGRWRRLAS